MTVLLDQIQDNLVSPIILAFVFGIVANLLRSDLKVPDTIFTALAIYFLFGIGLKGGFELSTNPWHTVFLPLAATILLGALLPVICALLILRIGRLSATYAALIAAHYGFVSSVALFGALNWLEIERIPFEPYLPSLIGALEVPSLLVGILVARLVMGGGPYWRHVAGEILFGKSILLIVGGTLIGFVTGESGYESVAPFFEEPFEGVTCLFMLELGMSAARQFLAFRRFGLFLVISFGLLAPVAFGMLGIAVGNWAGLSIGGCVGLAVLAASSAYVASAVAVRASLPDLNPDFYFTASLAVNLPFNFTVGFPLFLAVASAM